MAAPESPEYIEEMAGGELPDEEQNQAQRGPAAQRVEFHFCRECSNLLYPKEDKVNRRLMYACRTCQYSEPAKSACVYRNDLSNTVGETAGVTQDVGADPTLPRSPNPCPKCRDPQVVYFQSQQRSAETGMKLFFVCTSCGHIFK